MFSTCCTHSTLRATKYSLKICVSNIGKNVTEVMVYNHFAKCGVIRRLTIKRSKTKSNGHAIVEFLTLTGCAEAERQKHGSILGGELIHVHDKPEKNQPIGCSHFPIQMNCVFVNLKQNDAKLLAPHGSHASNTSHVVNEQWLSQIFGQYGVVTRIVLPRFRNNVPKSYCFIYYAETQQGFCSARAAISMVNGVVFNSVRLVCALGKKQVFTSRKRPETTPQTPQKKLHPAHAKHYKTNTTTNKPMTSNQIAYLRRLNWELSRKTDSLMQTHRIKRWKAQSMARKLHWMNRQVTSFGANLHRDVEMAVRLIPYLVDIPPAPEPFIFRKHTPIEITLNAAIPSVKYLCNLYTAVRGVTCRRTSCAVQSLTLKF